MGLNVNTNWALKKAKENKIKPKQRKSSKFEWEFNIRWNPTMCL
jgi:hypothetical protein